jgi:hypothetical protein
MCLSATKVVFLSEKTELFACEWGPPVCGDSTPEILITPTMGLSGHSLMVIGASGQNQISMLASQCLKSQSDLSPVTS